MVSFKNPVSIGFTSNFQMLKWDGSYLGEWEKNAIIKKEKIRNQLFLLIRISKKSEIFIACRAIKTKDKFPCIVDEMKSIFNLKKIGTHSIKFGSSHYVIYKTHWNFNEDGNGIILPPLEPLKNIPLNDPLRNELEVEIKKIIIYRDLLGLRGNIEPSILVNKKNLEIETINEHSSVAFIQSEPKSIITSGLAKRWFYKDDMDYYIQTMITKGSGPSGNTMMNSPVEISSRIRGEMNQLIQRIDPFFVSFVSFVLGRCLNHLI